MLPSNVQGSLSRILCLELYQIQKLYGVTYDKLPQTPHNTEPNLQVYVRIKRKFTKLHLFVGNLVKFTADWNVFKMTYWNQRTVKIKIIDYLYLTNNNKQNQVIAFKDHVNDVGDFFY